MNLKQNIKRAVPAAVIRRYHDFQFRRDLPAVARRQDRQDRKGLPGQDPGAARVIEANLAWLGRAQDRSASADGGVARHVSLLNGWSPSYPETTGYIVPTLLAEAGIRGDDGLRDRAVRMLDWLASIQFPDGSFQGGLVSHRPARPVTFNTGQILLGLAAGAAAFASDAYLAAMHKAATWLVETQDPDGCWRRFATPFAAPGDKAYETHVAWGLFEAERVAPGRGYVEAGLRQVRWALTRQAANGWFRDCCLTDPARPLTHTIGYVLRGLIEACRLDDDPAFTDAARRTADALAALIRPDGFLPGRLDSRWRPAVSWACLTGSVQIAWCLLQLFEWTGERRYLDTGRRANAYVRRTVAVDGDPDLLGGVRGAYPISGDYGRFEYLNWAAKFCIDAQRKELKLTKTNIS